ncbi:hypothetical protein ACP4OV_022771 [Aristida adscensionis]
MEGGGSSSSSSAGGGGGGVALRAAQEPRRAAAAAAEQEEKAGGGRSGAMKFRVRAPHGVGALLLIGGAAALGAAVVAWRHARRGKDGRRGERQPAKAEALNGGATEDEKVRASAAQEIDLTDESLSPENTEAGSNGSGDDRTEESQQIHEDTVIVADEPESERIENLDHKSTGEPTEISMHDVDGDMAEEVAVPVQQNDMAEEVEQIHENAEIVLDESESEPVDKSDHSSTRNLTGISIHDVDNEHVEKSDNISRRDPTEISMHFVDNVQVGKFDYNASRIPTHDMESEIMEKVDSIKNDIKKAMSPNGNDDVEISDQSTVCIKGPGIALLHKHINHTVCTQEPESMENTPTAQLIMHQEQLLDDMMTDSASETAEARSEEGTTTDKMDTVSETPEAKPEEGTVIDKLETVSETAEAKPGEGTTMDKNVSEEEEKKAQARSVELVGSPAPSSLVKLTEKTPLLGQNEMGMKLEQDRTNGVVLLKEHGLTRGGATPGGALMTMDRRSASMAILALVFAVTIGITFIMRIYAPLQAT